MMRDQYEPFVDVEPAAGYEETLRAEAEKSGPPAKIGAVLPADLG